jgi:hypothetical protein
MSHQGLVINKLDAEEILKLRELYPDYLFVTVMRDPAERLVSGYFSKINRFCKKFARPLYAWGKLRQLLAGPTAWGDVNVGNRYMRKFISFDEFVAALEFYGTDWDAHFALQSKLNGIAQVNYDQVIRLESLDTDLLVLLKERGLPAETLSRLQSIPRLNKTGSSEKEGQSLLTSQLQKRIAAIYRQDYEHLER